MKYLILSLFLLLSACATTPGKTVWIDVRSADEYAAGHLVGAVNIPHTEIATGVTELKLDKNTNIALYCGSGRRAGIAIEALQQLGYRRLTNEGGYDSLKQTHATTDERQ
ncbi:rhodanese-like domain-containing protein [Rheinheimera pleomorphica]|uniref:rhodanese-like domain-containing protein n=1 Tax=Rheinheimera pleomorphica TaxID=2703963 RepID=UPI001422DA43|nr:rhodanese-like domain-containing protein [Rheinheimera pleomorphica]